MGGEVSPTGKDGFPEGIREGFCARCEEFGAYALPHTDRGATKAHGKVRTSVHQNGGGILRHGASRFECLVLYECKKNFRVQKFGG